MVLTDAAINKSKHVSVLQLVQDYVEKGGVAIFTAQFSSHNRFINHNPAHHIFKKVCLDWEFGDDGWNEVHFNK